MVLSYPYLANSFYNLFVLWGERETLLLKKKKREGQCIIYNS